jgi:hypothetical protein
MIATQPTVLERVKVATDSIDTFICVHERDVDYLLKLVLRSYQVNFTLKGTLALVTNNPPYVRECLDRLGLDVDVTLMNDNEWLSKREMELPGWYRQQIIKLRSYLFCSTPNFCNLGADTLLLQPIAKEDLLDGDMPVLYYTRHWLPNPHFLLEWRRVHNVARILKTKPAVSRRYVDFINDLFCFNREALTDLNHYLERLHGPDCYYTLLHSLDSKRDQHRFGEWTLYSVYMLDYRKQKVTLRNTRGGFLHQIHSLRNLNAYKFDTKVAHFVGTPCRRNAPPSYQTFTR